MILEIYSFFISCAKIDTNTKLQAVNRMQNFLGSRRYVQWVAGKVKLISKCVRESQPLKKPLVERILLGRRRVCKSCSTTKWRNVLLFETLTMDCPHGFEPHLGWSSRCKNCFRNRNEHSATSLATSARHHRSSTSSNQYSNEYMHTQTPYRR